MPNLPPTTHRISQFYQWYKEKSLELAPPFQRKPVWSDRNKSFLVDTILSDLPVPEIYLQIKTDKNGKTKQVIVDGQQRTRSILDFIDGKFVLHKEESQDYGGKAFSDLPDGVKRDFWSYNIVTRELNTESLEEVKSIFLRLNKYVVPLNAQELRNATYSGYFIKMVNKIAEEDDFWADNRIVTPSDIKRMIDAEFISELFIAMMHGIQQKSLKDIDGFYLKYDRTFSDRTKWKRKFKSTEKKIMEILGDDLSKSRWCRKPEFYSLFIAIYELSQTYYFPKERYEDIKNTLLVFAAQIDYFTLYDEKTSDDILVKDYVNNAAYHTTHKTTRIKRYERIRQLLITHLIARDKKRMFNEEERRIAWYLSKEKKCAICSLSVNPEDYQLDHTIPFSKGGKTELKNSQITHIKCNLKKSNK